MSLRWGSGSKSGEVQTDEWDSEEEEEKESGGGYMVPKEGGPALRGYPQQPSFLNLEDAASGEDPLLQRSLSAPAGYATYHRRCQYHGIRPDPSVAICLYALHPVVKVSRLAQDLDLIPIVETLKTPAVAQFAREIDLSGLNLGSISALLVAEMVQSCSFLRVLLLGRNALRDEGASMIIAALKGNRELSKIDLRSNRISSAGALKIARLLQEKDVGRALNEVVFVNNHMMQQGVDAISEVCESRKIAVYLDGNLVMAEVLNSLTHGTGLVAAIIAGASMIEEADSRALPLQLYRSIVIFCVSLCCMFASSCFYHSFFRGAKGAKEILKVMDHCSIFLLIAGTYTPILLKFIWSPEHPHSLVGPTLFYLVWGLALVGITMSARLFGKYTPSRKVRAGLALIMGWLIIFSIRLLWQRMPPRCLLLLSLGGVAYTTGVPFYVKGQEVSMYHVVWHISVMIGAALHYLTVLNYVVRPGLEY